MRKLDHRTDLRPPDAEPRPTYTGQVSVTPVGHAEGAMRYSVVAFRPGARTGWHTHDGVQVLVVTEGEGLIANSSGDVIRGRAGVTVTIEPGEEHWHGATEASGMTHVAVTIGESHYVRPVEYDEHATAQSAAET